MVRGAFEASEVFDDFAQDKDQDAKARADAVIAQLAARLDKSERIVQNSFMIFTRTPTRSFCAISG